MNSPPVYSVRPLIVKSVCWLTAVALGTASPALARGLEEAQRIEETVAEVSGLIAAGDFESVLVVLQDLPALGADARLWNARGVALAGLGRDREAVSAYEHGIRTDPSLSEIHQNLAVSLERLGVTGRAMSEFEQAVELAPGSFEVRLGLGRALLRYSRLERARVELERALALDASDRRIWVALADLADAEGQPQTMREAWEALESRWPDARSARRLAELAQPHDPAGARAWLETCVARDPGDAACAAAAGAAALAAGDALAARGLLTSALELDPDQPQALHNLLLSYQIEGEIAGLERVVEQWPPRLPPSWGVVALARRAAADFEGALRAAEAAVTLAPEDLDLWNLVAVTLDDNGRRDEAVQRWEWILERDASHAEARRNLDQRRR